MRIKDLSESSRTNIDLQPSNANTTKDGSSSTKEKSIWKNTNLELSSVSICFPTYTPEN